MLRMERLQSVCLSCALALTIICLQAGWHLNWSPVRLGCSSHVLSTCLRCCSVLSTVSILRHFERLAGTRTLLLAALTVCHFQSLRCVKLPPRFSLSTKSARSGSVQVTTPPPHPQHQHIVVARHQTRAPSASVDASHRRRTTSHHRICSGGKRGQRSHTHTKITTVLHRTQVRLAALDHFLALHCRPRFFFQLPFFCPLIASWPSPVALSPFVARTDN